MKNPLLLNYMVAKNQIIYEFYYLIHQVPINNLNYPMVINLFKKKNNQIKTKLIFQLFKPDILLYGNSILCK
jgi:hypothetical protein